MADFDIELPACFYLGQEYDLAARALRKDRPPVMYDARDLLTHGVVVGMTGSGKTGLCVGLLEEAAIDGIPAIIIDPKGDLTNLLLQFPDLAPDDFREWLDPEDARVRGLTLEAYARQLSERWKQGLADSLQTPDRIRRLREASEYAIYTPGSDAGLPLSLLKTFAAPPPNTPREALNQKIDATAAALLGLSGVARDPLQSREHILIAQILLHAWGKGEDIDLAQLITRVQVPPVRTVGAFDVETFYPEKDRLKLAVALNHILAAPSFSTWIEGDPLDVGRLLYAGGKARQVIFYLAHLEDAQRTFFLTLLLEEILNWTRKQAGTSSLRAIVYMDEVYGYLPPHPANPPTKVPLMTLLKQARAFGVGVLLATQNPVDLDYKALSNAGTWFVGKLQTERDKARLLEGLEGVAAERGSLSDRAYLETAISGLGNRVFLMHDVHRPAPVLFQSRWALSFLRGPLTRDQVAKLMGPAKRQRAAEQPSPAPAAAPAPTTARIEDASFKEQLRRRGPAEAGPTLSPVPPVLASGVVQFYLPVEGEVPAGSGVVYQARLLAWAEVAFVDKKRGLDVRRTRRLLAVPPAAGQAVAWHAAESVGEALAESPAEGAQWAEVPESVAKPAKVKALQKQLADFLYSNDKLRLFENRTLGLRSEVGEDAATFQRRCQAAARQQADAEVQKLQAEYAARLKAFDIQAPPPPPAPTSLWGRALKLFEQSETVVLGPPKALDEARRQADALQAERDGRCAAAYADAQRVGQEREDVLLTPRRADVSVLQFGLAWAPFVRTAHPDGRVELVPAYRRS